MKKNSIIIFTFFLFTVIQAAAQKVYVIKVREEIAPQMSHFVELGLEAATIDSADYIILDMDTYGGALTDADLIRTAILEYPKPVYVFINKNAASAGALISIACDSIYMDRGSNIGSATVVDGEGKPAPDKYQSYMRAMMRTTAETNHRNPAIAESMVGTVIGTDSITVGKVTAFTTSEAIANKYCEAEVHSLDELYKRLHLDKASIVTFELDTTDEIINFFMNPALRGLLLLLIIGGVYFELQTPGVGFPLAAAIVGIVLYFVPSYLNGLAENWEILIFFIGAVLLILEITVIPGFGIAGLTGLTLIVASLILAALNNIVFDFTFVPEGDVYITSATVLLSFTGGIVLVFVAGNQFMKSAFFNKISVQETFAASDGYTSNFNTESLIGKQGTSYSVLRPSGKVMIDGTIYDAYSRGEFIEEKKNIEVIEQVGSSLKVKEIHGE
ncbi:NfeD family protein [Cytophaga aurantiaca]|uniref:NfeD family protein n=1 Tax=Cytophaga aurantiaca TaxID=29530 RepID=UPI0003711D02|nr:NfeD family protein [Cytophaga aurantiaca]